MEVALVIWLFVAVAAPFLAPLLAIVASPNRWVFLASLLLVPPLIAYLFGRITESDSPGAVAIYYVIPAVLLGAGIGVAIWLGRVVSSRPRPAYESTALYALTMPLFAALLWL